jgi:hypothetical protein
LSEEAGHGEPHQPPDRAITSKLDEGVRVIAGHTEEAARLGRTHQNRTLPV